MVVVNPDTGMEVDQDQADIGVFTNTVKIYICWFQGRENDSSYSELPLTFESDLTKYIYRALEVERQ